MNRAGKYDPQCEEALVATGAEGVILVVLSGEHGDGFAANFTALQYLTDAPALLRRIADELEREATW